MVYLILYEEVWNGMLGSGCLLSWRKDLPISLLMKISQNVVDLSALMENTLQIYIFSEAVG